MKWLQQAALENMAAYYLVDVRTHKQFTDGHLADAHNYPIVTEKLHYQLYDTYHQRGSFAVILEALPHLPHFWQYVLTLRQLAKTEETLVIYCSRARFRSKFAYAIIRCFNKNTYILAGGIKGLSQTDYEALCPHCGVEHVFNAMEVQNTTGFIHCKKCAQTITLYKTN